MENSIDILNELKALSPAIAGIEKVNVFTVPAGYFESLGATVLMSVKEEESDLLDSIKAPVAMQVPEGYFESLAGNILNKIKAADTAAAELKELSPILYSIPNKNVFTVPQGYFESLSADILGKVQPQQAKVVTMQRRSTSTILKYAIAAVFTGVMALGVFKFTGTGVKPPEAPAINYANVMKTDVDAELAKISDAEVLNFLTKEGVDVDAAVAVAQMQDKIETEETTTNDKKTESNEIDDLLNQLDDKQTN
jgi:FlaG/FlaF family flagellin (archaellin)